jgi:O-methyltransferase
VVDDTAFGSRYLEFLRNALTHELYGQLDRGPVRPAGRLKRAIADRLARRDLFLVKRRDETTAGRNEHGGFPLYAPTMIGPERLDNIRECLEEVLADDVPGDVIEAGVWRGGAVIWMRGILAAHGDRNRSVWVADSFAGMPEPEPDRYPADAGSEWHRDSRLVASEDEVRENFERYGLLDDRVRFLPGWFSETLPAIAEPRWALIRLDCDMYSSTFDALSALYPNLSPGGYLIADDYGSISESRQAVDDYRRENGIEEEIIATDSTCVYWRRAG